MTHHYAIVASDRHVYVWQFAKLQAKLAGKAKAKQRHAHNGEVMLPRAHLSTSELNMGSAPPTRAMSRLLCVNMGSAPPLRGAMSRLLCIAAFAAALQPQPRAPEPPRIEKTANYKAAAEASARLAGELKAPPASRKTVAVVGGGLSGLACGKYLSDAGHEATVYEARDVLGGKVSAWQDDDGDWIETGLHVFFGAYPNVLNLFKELDIRDRLQWKAHRMSFAMRERPGEFTSFEFPEGVPAPLNMAAAILTNTEMLSLVDKVRMVPGLLPMLLEGQSFIDEQDELSVLQFMEKYGMPDTVNEEIFIARARACIKSWL